METVYATYWWELLLRPDVIWVLIPIVAILGGIGHKIVKLVIAHRERMAMIEQGIHPDEVEAELKAEAAAREGS